MISKKANILIKTSMSDKGDIIDVKVEMDGSGGALISLLATIMNNDEDVFDILRASVSLVETHKAKKVKATTQA